MTITYVTGASGFIGRCLTQKLAEKGIPWAPLRREKSNQEWVDSVVPGGSICIHLAGHNDVKASMDYADQTIRETQELALRLTKMNFSRICFASSAVLYGNKSSKPHTEDDPVRLDHPYARAKLEAERILLLEGHTVIRLANVYGPGMAQHSLLQEVLKQIPENSETLLIRDGSCVRDFIRVEDAVDGFIDVAKLPESGIYNLGTGIGTKVRDLVQLVLDLSGQEKRRIVSQRTEDSRSCNVLDSSKLSSACGWTPKKSLREGIRDLLLSHHDRE